MLIFCGIKKSVLKFNLFFNYFLSLDSLSEFRMKLLSAWIELLYPPLIILPLTLTSLLMVTSFAKTPSIVKNLSLLRLAPIPKVFKSEKARVVTIEFFLILHRAQLSIERRWLNANKRVKRSLRAWKYNLMFFPCMQNLGW